MGSADAGVERDDDPGQDAARDLHRHGLRGPLPGGGDYDARVGTNRQQLKAERDSVARQSPASKALTRQLGSQAVVDVDGY